MEKTNWYVVSTASRAEKRVKSRLEQVGVESYLPTRVVEREYEGQVKRIEVPIICGCVFVRVPETGLSSILSISGVIALLKEEGVPVIVLDEQVEGLRKLNKCAEDIGIFTGEVPSRCRVRVVRGELIGMEGELIEVSDKYRIAIRVPHLVDVYTDIRLDCVEKL